MIGLLTAFFSSFIATLLIIRTQHLHGSFSSDSDLSGPQKFHNNLVPRIGGISIAIGILTATLFRIQSSAYIAIETTLLICIIPTFTIGLAEDLTKTIRVKTRLFFTMISAGLASYYLNAHITHLAIPGIDFLLSFPIASIVLTIFAITGLANAYNIIDGFNGLASMVGIITLLSLAYVSYLNADPMLIYLSLVMASAILGFFIWNYPRGLIFLGDGGAYLIGFWIAVLSILLVSRHSNISPWFALLINAYPIMETLFTIYRRKIRQGNPGLPDGIHFHTLIYRRILNTGLLIKKVNGLSANARTSPYLWVLSALAATPAIIYYDSTYLLMSFSLLFALTYLWLYRRIVCFKTPVWLHHRL